MSGDGCTERPESCCVARDGCAERPESCCVAGNSRVIRYARGFGAYIHAERSCRAVASECAVVRHGGETAAAASIPAQDAVAISFQELTACAIPGWKSECFVFRKRRGGGKGDCISTVTREDERGEKPLFCADVCETAGDRGVGERNEVSVCWGVNANLCVRVCKTRIPAD